MRSPPPGSCCRAVSWASAVRDGGAVLQVVVGIDVDNLVERTDLGVPEGPEFRVLLPQGQPFGKALLEFGHGPGS